MFPRRILVIQLRALGDTIILTAPLLELARRFPESSIDAMITEPYHLLLEGFPGIRKIFGYERRKKATARTRAIARLGFQLRKERYDWVINFHASPSSAALALATGARVRSIHFHGHRQKNHYSTVEVPGKGTLKPIIERNMDTIRALDIHVPAGKLPTLFLSAFELESGRKWIESFHLKGPLLGLSLGASRPTKRWPEERFATLGLEWIRKNQGCVVVVYGPNEAETIQSYLKALQDLLTESFPDPTERAHIRSKIVTVGDLSLRMLGAVLKQLWVLATSDSGPKHMAVAVGTPTVTLFGPEHPFEWHPYPLDEHPFLMIEDLSCRRDGAAGMPPWCGLNKCEIEEHKCMRLIGVDAVFKECLRVSKRPE